MLKLNYVDLNKVNKQNELKLKKKIKIFFLKKKQISSIKVWRQVELYCKGAYTPEVQARKIKRCGNFYIKVLNFNKRKNKIHHTDYFFFLKSFFIINKQKNKLNFKKFKINFFLLNLFFFN